MEIMSQKFTIYTDGGARGNPGPAAMGVIIKGPVETKKYGEYIGEATNNEAEYQAVIFALKKLKQLIGKEKTKSEAEVELHLDSELLASQLNAEYKIKEKRLQQLFLEVWNLKQDFKNVSFKHIPREDNRGADKLVNQALDKELSKLNL
ncbi:MAG: ribonuclease HI family protein [Parcubacteria group bacterium]|nr:ribonuclease HI family protein [Parcubacteria group bacterium]